jgi:hypothetical protein
LIHMLVKEFLPDIEHRHNISKSVEKFWAFSGPAGTYMDFCVS